MFDKYKDGAGIVSGSDYKKEMKQAVKIMESVKNKVNAGKMSTADGFYYLKGNETVSDSVLEFINKHWIDLDGYDQQQDERLALAEPKTAGVIKPTQEDRKRWDYETINEIKDDRRNLKDDRETYTGNGFPCDFTLISEELSYPQWVTVSDFVDFVNEAIKDARA